MSFLYIQFERDMEEGGGDGDDVTIGDKGILLYNQALIHLRVSVSLLSPYFTLPPWLMAVVL